MKKRLLPLLALLLVVGLAGLAVRRRVGQRNQALQFSELNPLLRALDLDADGTVNADELARAPESVRRLDRNGDGRITEDELLPGPGSFGRGGSRARELADALMAFDRNGDGRLTPDEVPERMLGVFARGDRNHDGALDAAEVRTLADISAASAARADFWPGGFLETDKLVTALDANHDGVISAEEIAAAVPALRRLDRNGDGMLSPEEIRPVVRPGRR